MSCRRLMKGPTYILRMPSLRWRRLPLDVRRVVDRVRISDRDDAGLVSSVPVPRHDPRHDPPAAVGLAGHQGGAARKYAQLPIRKPCTEYGYCPSLTYGVGYVQTSCNPTPQASELRPCSPALDSDSRLPRTQDQPTELCPRVLTGSRCAPYPGGHPCVDDSGEFSLSGGVDAASADARDSHS